MLYLRLALIVCLFFIFGCSNDSESSVSNNTSQSPETVLLAQTAKDLSLKGIIETPSNFSPLGTLIFAEGTSLMAVAASDGEFTISGVPAGQYKLFAMRDDLKPEKFADVVVTEAMLAANQQELVLEKVAINSYREGGSLAVGALAGAGVIKGRLVVARESDLFGILVEIEGTDIRTTTDSQGQYSLVNVPIGQLSLRFSQEGYVPAKRMINVITDAETTVSPVRLALRTPGAVGGKTIYGEVVLLDIDSQPVRDFSNTYITLGTSGERYYTDERGIFEISGLQAKAYEVSAKTEGYLLEKVVSVNLMNTDLAQVTLLLTEDPATADLSGLIVGQVLLEDSPEQGSAGVSVSLAGQPNSATTDAIGTFTLEDVAPGTYTLVAEFNGYETGYLENLTLPRRGLLTLEPLTLKKEVDYPEVLSTIPADGSVDVTIDEPTLVTIVFDEMMDISSVQGALGISPEVTYQFKKSSSTADRVELELAGYAKSGTPLKFGRQYTITLSTGAKSARGIGMEKDFSFSFRTGEAKVIASIPADGANNVFVSKTNPIRIYLNAPLDLKSLETSDIKFRPDLPSSGEVYLENDRRTGWGVLTIGVEPVFGEEYEVTIPNRIRTITNDRITNLPYSFRFTTTTRTEGRDSTPNRDTERIRLEEEAKRK
jgi:hypothetical protein